MAASSYSTILGLSLWNQTDCPKLADFLQDNQKLEQLAGGHIANNALHLTAEEKQFLSQRTALLTYTGTGSGGASVTLPFLPRRLTVYAQGKPSLLPPKRRGLGCIFPGVASGGGLRLLWHGRNLRGGGHPDGSAFRGGLLWGNGAVSRPEPQRRHLCGGAGSIKGLTAAGFCTIIGTALFKGGQGYV